MITMKSLGGWSFSDLKEIETLDDLLWWHNETVKNYNKTQQTGQSK